MTFALTSTASPTNPKSRRSFRPEWLGKLYENEKRPDLAAEQYKAALALDPQNKLAREALKSVQ
jgi:Tfp pilus assembly protein PilF